MWCSSFLWVDFSMSGAKDSTWLFWKHLDQYFSESLYIEQATYAQRVRVSPGLSSLIVKFHQIALSSFLLCFQTITAHKAMPYSSLVKWKMNEHSSRYCFLPATPHSLPMIENFYPVRTWGCFQRHDALFLSQILQLILSHGDLT